MDFVARYALFFAALGLTACSSVSSSPPPVPPKVASQAPQPASVEPKASPRATVAHEQEAAPPAAKASPPQASNPPKSAVAPARPTAPKPPTAAEVAAPKPQPAAGTATPTPPAVAQAAAPKPAPLDLKTLEQRLKDTSAIGVLTKLSLKNQVDDLVARFRAYHGGARPPTLADLRPGFDLLLMKVLSLLQDKDAVLARDINASRDAIWNVLADKQKFAEFS